MYEDGRLAARPAKPVHPVQPGVHRLALPEGGRGCLLIPSTNEAGPRPFVLMLHGAGGTAERGLDLLRPLADAEGIVVLSPQSAGRTWDALLSGYGPDVEVIDDLIAVAFARFEVDPTRLGIGGFSDGASYALSLGMTNGDLFTHVLAFSPGFAAPTANADSPRIFIAHGTGDTVLPIARCSRRLAPALRRAGYDTVYREFDGGHTIPAPVGEEAVQWFKQSPRRAHTGMKGGRKGR